MWAIIHHPSGSLTHAFSGTGNFLFARAEQSTHKCNTSKTKFMRASLHHSPPVGFCVDVLTNNVGERVVCSNTSPSRTNELANHHGSLYLFAVPRNYDPVLHPFEAPREYMRAMNAVKLERVFAKPFLGSLDGHRDGVHCVSKHPKSLSTLLSGSCDGEVSVCVCVCVCRGRLLFEVRLFAFGFGEKLNSCFCRSECGTCRSGSVDRASTRTTATCAASASIPTASPSSP